MEHKHTQTAARDLATVGLMIALAFTLSWLESLIPFSFGVPGVKLGLSNLVVVTALYALPLRRSFPVALARILLAGLLFGNGFSLIYSLAGGMLSFGVMLLLKRGAFSPAGVSVAGGVSHNLGQFAAACILLGTNGLFYYLPVLLASGLVTGLLIGGVALPVIRRLDRAGFTENGKGEEKNG